MNKREKSLLDIWENEINVINLRTYGLKELLGRDGVTFRRINNDSDKIKYKN